MLSEVSLDEIFMHYFEKMSKPPDLHRCSVPGPPWGTFVLQTPSLPNPGKSPAGTHGCLNIILCDFYVCNKEIKPTKSLEKVVINDALPLEVARPANLFRL